VDILTKALIFEKDTVDAMFTDRGAVFQTAAAE